MLLISSLLYVITCMACVECGLFSWIFDFHNGKAHENVSPSKSQPTSDLSAVVPFEMTSDDNNFIATTQNALQLSELDSCNHKVILKVKSSCTDMSEDDLAKLGVALLNCQSYSEGRTIYPCTADMTIQECTQNMDPDTWNAYHIVSNRARAVCYSVRQQQFRVKTEYTVNKLADTVKQQLGAMYSLQEGQDQVAKTVASVMEGLSDGHEKLLNQQQSLYSSQNHLHFQVSRNLHELVEEKSLIASGHKQLAEMTDDIKRKLDTTTEEIFNQEMTRKQNHDEVLEDLATIREKAKEVWNKIDESTRHIATYHNEATDHYRETLHNLQKVNDTVNYLLSIVDSIKRGLDARLGWLLDIAGNTDESVKVLMTCALHMGYFFLVTVAASLLNTPAFSRVVLLLLIALNVISEIKQKTSLSFTAMTLFIILTVLTNWMAIFMLQFTDYCFRQKFFKTTDQSHVQKNRNTVSSPLPALKEHAKTDLQNDLNASKELFNSSVLSGKPPTTAVKHGSVTETSTTNVVSTKLYTSVSNASPKPSMTSFVGHLDQSNLCSTPQKAVEEIKRDLFEKLDHVLPDASTISNRSTSWTLVDRRKSLRSNHSRMSMPVSYYRSPCGATTRAGTACKLYAMPGTQYCYKHEQQ